MAQATSNLLPTTSPFLLAPKKATSPFSTPTSASNLPPNTGVGTNGALMSVVPPALKSTTPALVNTSVPKAQPLVQNTLPQTTSPTQTPQQIAGIGTPQTPAQIATNTGQNAPTTASAPSTTFPGLVGLLQGASTPSGTQTGLISNLQKTANNNPLESGGAYDVYGKAVQNLSNFKNQLATANANIEQEPIPLNFQQGREQVLARQAASQQDALQQAVTQAQQALGYGIQEQGTQLSGLGTALGGANTQQAQQISGLGTAGNLASPVQVSPGNYLASPLTATAGSASEGQAQGIQNATNWAIAQQNMSQGQNYQGQAQELSNALQVLQPLAGNLTQFMTSNDLNPSNIPIANTQINKIDAQTNPQAYATMQAAIQEARSYAIQMLGSQSGANPTDVTSAVSSYDFSKLTPKQLVTFFQNLDTLGQYRLSQAQSASQASYGANSTVGTPAQGVTATSGNALQGGGANTLNNIPNAAKLWLGGASSLSGGVLDSLGGLANQGTAVVAGGLAEKVLAL